MRTTMKLVLATAIASITLQANAATPEGQLTLWVEADKAYEGMAKVGDWFEEETGIKVVVEHPDDLGNKFPQAASVGQGPDVLLWAHDRFGGWAESGLLEELTPTQSFKSTVFNYTLDALSFNGKLYGYPLSVEAVGLIYNKALVTTPPTSFEAIFALDKELKKTNQRAIIWDYNNTYFSWGLFHGQGGYVFKFADGAYDTANIGVANEGSIAAGKLIKKLIDDKVMPEGADYSVMESEFVAGNAAMIINGPWSWNNYRKSEIDFGVTTLPSYNGKQSGPFVGVKGYAISTASSNKDLAVEFLENYLLTPKGLKMLDADKPLGLPANKAFADELGVDEFIKATQANADTGIPMPNVPQMSAFWESMEAALKNITSGRQSVEEALAAAQTRMQGGK